MIIRRILLTCALAALAAPISGSAATAPPMKPHAMKTPKPSKTSFGCHIVKGRKICKVGGTANSHP
jgi:hypothetical protein